MSRMVEGLAGGQGQDPFLITMDDLVVREMPEAKMIL